MLNTKNYMDLGVIANKDVYNVKDVFCSIRIVKEQFVIRNDENVENTLSTQLIKELCS